MSQFHFKPQPDLDGITKFLNLSAQDVTPLKRSRDLADPASLIAYLKKWGDPAKATIYWNEEKVVALLEETNLVRNGGYGASQDRLTYDFARPLVTARWLGAIGNTFSHRKFKEFLELRYPEIIGGADLFSKISNLSLAQTFTYDGKLEDDQAYSIAFKTEAGPDVAKLPKVIEVEIPLLKGLEKTYKLQLRLKFVVPTEEKQPPTFTLYWDDRDEVLEQAARDAVALIATELPDYLVVNGTPD